MSSRQLPGPAPYLGSASPRSVQGEPVLWSPCFWLTERLAGFPLWSVVCPDGLYKSRLSRPALGMPFLPDLSEP